MPFVGRGRLSLLTFGDLDRVDPGKEVELRVSYIGKKTQQLFLIAAPRTDVFKVSRVFRQTRFDQKPRSWDGT